MLAICCNLHGDTFYVGRLEEMAKRGHNAAICRWLNNDDRALCLVGHAGSLEKSLAVIRERLSEQRRAGRKWDAVKVELMLWAEPEQPKSGEAKWN
jgi:hypothetical protein